MHQCGFHCGTLYGNSEWNILSNYAEISIHQMLLWLMAIDHADFCTGLNFRSAPGDSLMILAGRGG
jgi:hypothetical protein